MPMKPETKHSNDVQVMALTAVTHKQQPKPTIDLSSSYYNYYTSPHVRVLLLICIDQILYLNGEGSKVIPGSNQL